VAPDRTQAGPLGLLRVLDLSTFGTCCVAYGRWRHAERMLAKEELVVEGSDRQVSSG
jgi:hypothetical protein